MKHASAATLPLFPSGPLTEEKPPPTLRPYQQRAVKTLQIMVMAGKKRVLLVAPCGSGKMVIIAYIIRTATVPILFAAHRQELLNQCVNELAAQNIHNVSVLRADDPRYDPNCSIQIGSIQTISRRELPFEPGIIIIDESHRAPGSSYVELIKEFPNAIVLGFSATPCRLDGKPLGGDLFQELITIVTYQELLKNPNWLVGPDIYGSPFKPDLSQVETSMGDFQEDQLALAMSKRPLVGNAVQHWLRMAHRHPVFENGVRVPMKFQDGERRRTFVFAVNIVHSMMLAEEFERNGVRVAHLDGTTPDNQRKSILADIRSGALEVVCNCNILLEGVDIPAVKCVTHCRPTQSLTLWMQSTMRIGRPWNGVIPLLLDHAENFDRHGSPCEDRKWSLVHKPIRSSGRLPMKLCHSCFAYVEAGGVICPHCGEEFPKQQQKTPEHTEAELVLRNAQPEDQKRSFFQKMAILARTRGYKPGFAAAKWRDEYGIWPPDDWSNGLKAIFETDEKWQALNKTREEKKRKEAEAQAEEERKWKEMEAAAGFYDGGLRENQDGLVEFDNGQTSVEAAAGFYDGGLAAFDGGLAVDMNGGLDGQAGVIAADRDGHEPGMFIETVIENDGCQIENSEELAVIFDDGRPEIRKAAAIDTDGRLQDATENQAAVAADQKVEATEAAVAAADARDGIFKEAAVTAADRSLGAATVADRTDHTEAAVTADTITITADIARTTVELAVESPQTRYRIPKNPAAGLQTRTATETERTAPTEQATLLPATEFQDWLSEWGIG